MTAPKILIIDDDESVRLTVANMLNDQGYLISMAADGEAGLAQIRGSSPDAVFCDLVMPGMDGFEVLRQVRADAATAGLPFTLLISVDDRDYLRRGMRPGADEYLSKPVRREELIASVQRALNKLARAGGPAAARDAAAPGATYAMLAEKARAAAAMGAVDPTLRFVIGSDAMLKLETQAEPEIKIRGYKTLSRLNQGGMSLVYLADDLTNQRQVVLKMLKARRNEDERILRRFFQQANLLSSINHEHVVHVFDQGFGDGMAYIAMEYLSGGSLRGVMDQGLSQRQALSLLSQAASGLAEIHRRGIVHRDIKPSNMVLRSQGVLVLTDFGIARHLDQSDGNTVRGEILGTPHYMSPEQAQGEEIGTGADIYSLGAIFYEMLTGQRLYPGETVIEILSQQTIAPIPRLGADLAIFQPLIDGMLAKQPDERFANADAVLEEVDRVWTQQAMQKHLESSSGESDNR